MNVKKLCAVTVLTCMLSGITAPAAWAAVQYPDVDATTVTGQAIVKMTEAGVVGGYEDGTFRPDGSLTRAEFVKIVNGVFRYKETDTTVPMFDDVTSHWAEGQIIIAQQAGYIGGVGSIEGVGSHCFAPDATITREQVAVILSRILKLENIFNMQLVLQDEVSDWAKADVEKAILCGVFTLEDNNTFRATRRLPELRYVRPLAPYAAASNNNCVRGNKNRYRVLLQEAAAGLKKLHYEDAEMATIVNTLQSSVNQAVQAGWKGVKITREYVETTYAVEIEQTKTAYRNLSVEKRQQLKTDIVNSMSLDAISVLYDYFLGEV